MKASKTLIKQVIKEFQETALPEVFPRELELPLKPEKIIALSGPRRSGKTYLIFGLIKKLRSDGVLPEQITYLNFEDPRLLPFEAEDFEVFYEAYRELYPGIASATEVRSYLFLDEVQAAHNWQLGVRRLLETRKFYIYITGSSSKLKSYEIATELRGRALNYELFPFSFAEMLRARGLTVNEDSQYSGLRFSISHAFEEFLNYGGFPEVVLADGGEQKFRILQSYMETMFIRDLAERYEVRNQAVLREMVKYLATNAGTQFSINSFYRWIKTVYPVTKRTLINYLGYLEDSRLFLLWRRLSRSLKEQALSPKKVYLVDVGLKEVYGYGQSRDTGRRLENVVAIELARRRAKNPRLEVFFWKDSQKREVDFVVTEMGRVKELVQVCADISDVKVKQRELRALEEAVSRELRCDNLKIITLETEGREILEKGREKIEVAVIPAWKWLLGFA